MVGRERELEVLTGIWERVAAERRPHLVTVFGPAGIGKSWLALELMEYIGAQDCRVLRGRSTPYGAASPYGAFAQHVKQVAKVYDSDELAAAHGKLAAAVSELVGAGDADEHTHNLSLLMGLDDEVEVATSGSLSMSTV
jgi:predicted ATPase